MLRACFIHQSSSINHKVILVETYASIVQLSVHSIYSYLLVKMYFESYLVAVTWGIVGLGVYLMFNIIKYLKEKPPGMQTLLDGIHQQLLWIWIVESSMLLVMVSLVNWGFKSYPTALIFGYGTFVIICMSSIHLMICVVTRIGLVFFQETIEDFLEDHILLTVM